MPTEAADISSIVRLQGESELGGLRALVAASPEAPAWPANAWMSFLSGEQTGDVQRRLFAWITPEEALAGVVAVTLVEFTAELELLLVHPAWRRREIGRSLSQHWLRWAAEADALEAVLEVRASNYAAQLLYGELGFKTHGRRSRYYQYPEEDALLMRKRLKA